jgi:hypothetical protein
VKTLWVQGSGSRRALGVRDEDVQYVKVEVRAGSSR